MTPELSRMTTRLSEMLGGFHDAAEPSVTRLLPRWRGPFRARALVARLQGAHDMTGPSEASGVDGARYAMKSTERQV